VLTRRELAALALAAAAAPLAACGEDQDRWHDVGALDAFDGAWKEAQLTDPALEDTGPWMLFVRRDGDGAVALDQRCPHLGCPVRWTAPSEKFICPCHGGVFDDRGKPLGGPPKKALHRRAARVVDGRVQVAWPS
jgi:Rieske Fe-S protein